MAFSRASAITGEDFRRGFRLQRTWGLPMATAFFLGEVGAGLFLVSACYDFLMGMIAGLLLTGVGKSSGHLLHMGRPERSWRAIVKVRRAWVSRGLLAITLFVGFGILHVLDLAGLTSGLLPRSFAPAVTAIAAAAAVVVMVYQGMAMSHSTAIALWSTGIMPVIGFVYAMLAGVSLTLALGFHPSFRMGSQQAVLLQTVELGLMFLVLVALVGLLHAARFGSRGGRFSAELLLRGRLAPWFLGLVFGAGLAVPALALAWGAQGTAGLVAVCVLAGYYTFRVLIFKAAVYDPIQSFLSD